VAEQAIPEAQQVEKVHKPDNPYYMGRELIREKKKNILNYNRKV